MENMDNWEKLAAEQARERVTQAQELELERRLADDEANPDDGISWDAIRAAAHARSQQ